MDTIVCMDISINPAGALAGSILWGSEEGLTVHNTSQHGAAALQCMSFQPKWSTALDRCKYCKRKCSSHVTAHQTL